MKNRERAQYLGNVALPDPTAWEALATIEQPTAQTESDLVEATIRNELRWLRQQRRIGRITAKDYWKHHTPLIRQLVECTTTKGGK